MNKNIIVASHRRSGTHFTIDTLFNNFDCFNMFEGKPYLNLDSKDNTNSPPEGRFILKTHSTSDIKHFLKSKVPQNNSQITDLLSNSKIIYVYRDGRDVLLSLYNYQKKFDKSLDGVSFSDFIRQDNTYEKHIIKEKMSRAKFWANHVNNWSKRNDVLLICFDELKENLESVIVKMELFIGEKSKNSLINVSLSKKEDNDLIDRKISVVRSSISFNKGVSGGWREYFTKDDLDFFNIETSI